LKDKRTVDNVRSALTPAANTLCVEASNLLKKNIQKLKEGIAKSEPEQYLRDWAIVLGVLARDVFDSTVILLNAGQLRGANMLSRALVDYDIRLRYYVVQYMNVRDKYKNKAHVMLKDKMETARDWDNWNYKLGKVLNLYDPSVWPEEVRESLTKLMKSEEKERGSAFADMVAFLLKHEVRVRQVISYYAAPMHDRYSSMRANWRMQSAFLHGDQVIISDVIEFDGDGKRTGNIIEIGPASPNVILFTALDHVLELLASFEEIHGDASGKAAFKDNVGAVWHNEYVPPQLSS
jgi:hypothetical protein